MLGFLIRAVIVALGLWVATTWVSGITIDSPQTLLLAGVLLGLVNAVIRPIAILLTLPMTLLTLGFFLLVINAGMVALVAWMLPGMTVSGFGAASRSSSSGIDGGRLRSPMRLAAWPWRDAAWLQSRRDARSIAA
jgi:putative membrane protein